MNKIGSEGDAEDRRRRRSTSRRSAAARGGPQDGLRQLVPGLPAPEELLVPGQREVDPANTNNQNFGNVDDPEINKLIDTADAQPGAGDDRRGRLRQGPTALLVERAYIAPYGHRELPSSCPSGWTSTTLSGPPGRTTTTCSSLKLQVAVPRTEGPLGALPGGSVTTLHAMASTDAAETGFSTDLPPRARGRGAARPLRDGPVAARACAGCAATRSRSPSARCSSLLVAVCAGRAVCTPSTWPTPRRTRTTSPTRSRVDGKQENVVALDGVPIGPDVAGGAVLPRRRPQRPRRRWCGCSTAGATRSLIGFVAALITMVFATSSA